MAKRWSEKFSFLRGAIAARDLAYVVLAKDELSKQHVPHGLCARWEAGKWKEAGLANWLTVGIGVLPDSRMVVVGETGKVLLSGEQGEGGETIPIVEVSGKMPGLLTGLSVVDGKAFAIGMRRQVWRRDGPGQWSRVDDDSCRRKESDRPIGFEAIDGYSAGDLFAVGWQGEVWRCSSGIWSNLPSPTGRILQDVCCAPDGVVYACGQGGTLLRGADNGFSEIRHEATRENFWSICWHEGQIYLSTSDNLWTVRGETLKPVALGDDPPRSFHDLSSKDGLLWSIGPKDVMAYDGDTWKRID